MKNLQIIILSIGSIGILALFASCQSTKQVLSKQDSRHEIMIAIANDHAMSAEMLELLMNSEHGKMIMQQNEKMKMMDGRGMMMMMMKDKPVMMHHMMTDMMATAKSDTSMMATMCKSMMDNPEMMNMMKKMRGNEEEMKKMKKMDH